MTKAGLFIAVFLAAIISGCGGPPVNVSTYDDADVPSDSATVGDDAGHDAGSDAVVELDAGHDAGPTCECTTGPCCDGCHVRPSTHRCLDDGPVRAECSTRPYPGPSCVGSDRITVYLGDRYCDGVATECSGRTVEGTSSVNDRCTYDALEWDWLTCRADSSDLGASCARWCG